MLELNVAEFNCLAKNLISCCIFSDNAKNKLSLPSTFKRKYTQIKKMTSKQQSKLDATASADAEAKSDVEGLVRTNDTSSEITTSPTNTGTANLKQPHHLSPPQPTGFLRKLSFRDRRGSSPFLNTGADTIIPLSKKYLNVPSPNSSPSTTSKLA